jgi:hypothetical protein
MEQQQITPKEAITILDKAVQTLRLDRNEHVYLINALNVLQQQETDFEKAKGEIVSLKEEAAKALSEKLTDSKIK